MVTLIDIVMVLTCHKGLLTSAQRIFGRSLCAWRVQEAMQRGKRKRAEAWAQREVPQTAAGISTTEKVVSCMPPVML